MTFLLFQYDEVMIFKPVLSGKVAKQAFFEVTILKVAPQHV